MGEEKKKGEEVNKKLVLCIEQKEFEAADNILELFILVKCKLCETFVYLNIDSVDKDPVCASCAAELIRNNEVNIVAFLNIDDFKDFLRKIVKYQNEKLN